MQTESELSVVSRLPGRRCMAWRHSTRTGRELTTAGRPDGEHACSTQGRRPGRRHACARHLVCMPGVLERGNKAHQASVHCWMQLQTCGFSGARLEKNAVGPAARGPTGLCGPGIEAWLAAVLCMQRSMLGPARATTKRVVGGDVSELVGQGPRLRCAPLPLLLTHCLVLLMSAGLIKTIYYDKKINKKLFQTKD